MFWREKTASAARFNSSNTTTSRQRQMWLDIGQMRQQMDRQEADRLFGKKPC
jgi:hypothetical protein